MSGQDAGRYALVADDLSCGYDPAVPILSRVSLKLRSGRFVCVIGPNGIGKSTLMHTLCGLLPPLTGTVVLGRYSLGALSPRERARELSMVLTGQRPPGFMSVRRYVEIGRYPHLPLLGAATTADREAVEHALDTAGVLPLAERAIAELSDGERQRASIARALAQSSRIMMLDEPTAFLDVSARAATMVQLRETAHSTDRLVITSSHEIELVLRTADTVVMIRPDRSLSIGSPEDLVLRRELDHLFSDTALSFDYERGSFQLPPSGGPSIRVVGTGDIAVWTSHALERVGFTVSRAGSRTVRVPDLVHEQWVIENVDGSSFHVSSLEQLADRLRD